MAEELQSLLERIQKDGVAKADAEAQAILAKAKRDAAAIVKDAEERAKQAVARGERDAQVFAERGRKALEQAARDVVLSAGQAIEETLRQLVGRKVEASLTDDVVKQMLVEIAKAYAAREGGAIELLLSEAQCARLRDQLLQECAQSLRQGMTIQGSGRIASGFRVSTRDGAISHDFTAESLADAMSQLLRPHLGEIVRKAIAGKAQ